jgi:polysaccharide pyruvyl transferase WcaK-like protein
VAVWGHFHGGNLGDDLVVSTVVDAILDRYPGARIIGISLAPADTRVRHGIEAFPINPGAALVHRRGPAPAGVRRSRRLRELARRIPLLVKARNLLSTIARVAREPRFALQVYRLLRDVDLVVVAGSGAIADFWGPWQHPYTTFRWAGLARLARTPMVFLSVGAGPVEARLSAFFFRCSIAWSSYCSARDRDSARVLASLGVPEPVPVVADMAFGLPERFWPGASDTRRSRGDAVVVGLNVMAYEDPRYLPDFAAGRYQAYVGRMADFARSLLEEGHSVVLFSSQTVADELVALDVMDLLAAEAQSDGRFRSSVNTIRELDDLVRVLATCDLIVATRFHSALLPILFGLPVIGIAYHPKTSELLRDVGYPERALEIDKATGPELMDMVRALLAENSPVERQREAVGANRAAVKHQFDVVFRENLGAPTGVRPDSEGRFDPWGDVDGADPHRAVEPQGFRADGSGS